MLYMIGMIGRDNRFIEHFYIKIGFTHNIKLRMKVYKTHNHLVIPMYQMAGNEELEKVCQKRLAFFLPVGCTKVGEWYEVYKKDFLDFTNLGFSKIGCIKGKPLKI